MSKGAVKHLNDCIRLLYGGSQFHSVAEVARTRRLTTDWKRHPAKTRVALNGPAGLKVKPVALV